MPLKLHSGLLDHRILENVRRIFFVRICGNIMTQQLYFDDPFTLDFEAEVLESRSLDGGRFGVVLPRTYFYPTSGGQEHDTSSIGKALVLDVLFKETKNYLTN